MQPTVPREFVQERPSATERGFAVPSIDSEATRQNHRFYSDIPTFITYFIIITYFFLIAFPRGYRLYLRYSRQILLKQQEMAGIKARQISHIEGDDNELDVEHGPAPGINSSSAENEKEGYKPPETEARNVEYTSSAVLVKDVDGNPIPAKLLFDSGSSGNWASNAFVTKTGLLARLILPKDLKIYKTVNGDYTPTHYVEVELQDDFRNIKTPTKVSFNITPSMGGIGLVAGRPFMKEHRIILDPNGRHDGFVAIGRKASAGKLAAGQLSQSLLTLILQLRKGIKNDY